MARSKSAAASNRPAREAGSRTSAVVESQPRSVGAPDVPRGFRPPTALQTSRFKKLTRGQYAQAGACAAEIREGAPSFEHDFGRHTPDPGEIADALDAAAQWRAESTRAQAWADYALARAEVQGDAAGKLIEAFKAAFEAAVADEPSIARRYAATVKLLSERSALAKKGAATRAKKQKRAQSAK